MQSCSHDDQYSFYFIFFQIYTNGYITLDSNFESPNPASLDPNNNPQKMVAPFWSDIDMKSDSKIWYQLYNRFEDAGASDVSSVLSKVQSLVVENFRDSSVAGSFEPNTALVVTWENVVQSPARDHAAQVIIPSGVPSHGDLGQNRS